MTDKISSSAATTSAADFDRGPRSASRWNSDRAPSVKSARRSKERSRLNDGPAWIELSARPSTKARALPIFAQQMSYEDPELRRLMVGRAAKLERLGLAEQVAPGCWSLKPGFEQTLRELSTRGDIIKTMHRAMTGAGREPDISGFALHGDELSESGDWVG